MGIFDSIIKKVYNKLVLNEGDCRRILSEKGLEYTDNLFSYYGNKSVEKLKDELGIEIFKPEGTPYVDAWCIVHHNTFCEQGGTFHWTRLGPSERSVPLPKEFRFPNYEVLVSLPDCEITIVDTTSFKIKWNDFPNPLTLFDNGTAYISWRASGFVY